LLCSQPIVIIVTMSVRFDILTLIEQHSLPPSRRG